MSVWPKLSCNLCVVACLIPLPCWHALLNVNTSHANITLLVACLATSLCICNGSQRFTEDDHREGEEERVAESITLWWCWAGNWSDIVLRESAGGRCASSRGYLQVNELYKWIWNYNFKVKKKKLCCFNYYYIMFSAVFCLCCCCCCDQCSPLCREAAM